MIIWILSDGHPGLTHYGDDAGLFSSAIALSLNALPPIPQALDTWRN
jgi:hypothetical protein